MTAELAPRLLDSAVTNFRYYKRLSEKALEQLPDEQLHTALTDETNSVAVIVQHLGGNLVSRFTDFLTSDGEKPTRDRDQEFVERRLNRHELLQIWEAGWQCLFDTLAAFTPDDLVRDVKIRGESLSVPLALERSLAHAAYHAGQIVLICRILVGENWQTLTIPRGESQSYNQRQWGQNSFRNMAEEPKDAGQQ